MTEYYVLCDMDNRDGGAPLEITAYTLFDFVGYVDGPLRRDVTSDEAIEIVNNAVNALQRENFPLAKQHLREVGVYLRLEVEEDE